MQQHVQWGLSWLIKAHTTSSAKAASNVLVGQVGAAGQQWCWLHQAPASLHASPPCQADPLLRGVCWGHTVAQLACCLLPLPAWRVGNNMFITWQVGDPETEWGKWTRPEDQTAANDKPRPVHLVSSSRPGGDEASIALVLSGVQKVPRGLLHWQAPRCGPAEAWATSSCQPRAATLLAQAATLQARWWQPWWLLPPPPPWHPLQPLTCPPARPTCTPLPRPTASRGWPCLLQRLQRLQLQVQVPGMQEGRVCCCTCNLLAHMCCQLAGLQATSPAKTHMLHITQHHATPPCRSWSPTSGQAAYSSSNSADDLALAAAWRCRQGVAGSCAEATSQLDKALADGSVYWSPVGQLGGWRAGWHIRQAA